MVAKRIITSGRTTGDWDLVQKLLGERETDFFGFSLATDNDTLAVGAPQAITTLYPQGENGTVSLFSRYYYFRPRTSSSCSSSQS
jgi:hypothetical protein